MSKPINLGRKPQIEVHKLDDIAEKTFYPSLFLSDVDDRLKDLPDEGECTIKYKIRRREHREVKNGDGKSKKSCSLDMDVLSIEPAGGQSYKKNGDKDEPDKGARKAFKDYFKDK